MKLKKENLKKLFIKNDNNLSGYQLFGNGYCLYCLKSCGEVYLQGEKRLLWLHSKCIKEYIKLRKG